MVVSYAFERLNPKLVCTLHFDASSVFGLDGMARMGQDRGIVLD